MSDTASHNEVFDRPTSIKAQLAAWHATRGNKSFARAMIPTWKTAEVDEERTTRNPFKLLGMVSPFAWAMFFSVGRDDPTTTSECFILHGIPFIPVFL